MNDNIKKTVIGALLLVVIALAWLFLQARNELAQVKLAYEHPKTEQHTNTRLEAGPTTTTTRVTRPTGEIIERTKIVEHRVIEKSNDIRKTPVFAPQNKRWFVGVSFSPFQYTDIRHYNLWGGVTLFNRLDVGYGLATTFDEHRIDLRVRF